MYMILLMTYWVQTVLARKHRTASKCIAEEVGQFQGGPDLVLLLFTRKSCDSNYPEVPSVEYWYGTVSQFIL